jgi:tetratricopeptide (TPR) repeat protein
MSKMKSVVTTALFAAFFSLFVFSAAPVFAQDAVRSSAERKVQYSSEELENFRADLINFVRAYQEAARFVGPKQAQNFNGIEEQLLRLSLEQLNVIHNGTAGVKKMNSATKKLESAVQQASLRGDAKARQNGEALENASGFPNADYPSCGTNRVDDAIIDASDTALFAAEVIRDVASRGCNQVAVVAGFGANLSTACIVADGIYHAAKIINYGLHYCNDKIDQAEQGATYGRLGHLHSDLENSVANDNANAASIISNDNTNNGTVLTNLSAAKTEIINNDNTNKNTIVTTVGNAKTDIINNAAANRDTIVTAIENAKTTIVVNANANKDEVVRLAIAADLSEADNATPVAVFMLPAVKGGYIEMVRTIVVHAITNLAGSSISQANSFLAQADAYKAAGDYKKAYAWYRKAYKSATN